LPSYLCLLLLPGPSIGGRFSLPPQLGDLSFWFFPLHYITLECLSVPPFDCVGFFDFWCSGFFWFSNLQEPFLFSPDRDVFFFDFTLPLTIAFQFIPYWACFRQADPFPSNVHHPGCALVSCQGRFFLFLDIVKPLFCDSILVLFLFLLASYDFFYSSLVGLLPSAFFHSSVRKPNSFLVWCCSRRSSSPLLCSDIAVLMFPFIV